MLILNIIKTILNKILQFAWKKIKAKSIFYFKWLIIYLFKNCILLKFCINKVKKTSFKVYF